MNDLMNRNNELFLYIHPYLRGNFIKLCRDGNIGLKPVSINNISYLERKLIDSKYAHSFKIQIPYAGKFLSWDILFDPEDLTFAPDIDINDDSFPQNIDIDEVVQKIPVLSNWDLANSDCLEIFLRELLQLYKRYQVEELTNRMNEHYQLLMNTYDISPDDVEVLSDLNNVYFLISIKVTLSDLPEYVQQVDERRSYLNPKEDFALLQVNFQKSDASRVNTHLQLSPRLEQLIGNSKTLLIPNFERDGSLVRYVSSISTLLKNQIDKVAYNCQFKKEFVTSIVSLKSKSIVEYDSLKFDKITLLCEVNNFHTLVQVMIGDEFPKERPNVKLFSIYCTNPKTKSPCERGFQHKHRLNQPDEMARHFLSQLTKAVSDFADHHIARDN